MKLKPVDQQVVVIVGATSGIGRETALRFAREGARIVVAGRSEPALQTLVQEIQQNGGNATYAVADVSDFSQVKGIADKAISTFGRIDSWVHLAATSMYAPFEQTQPDEFKRVIDVNLLGQAYGAMAALPHLRNEGRGALIHVSSVEARRSLPLQSAYSASKHGLAGFLDSLRVELQTDDMPIYVTNIMPSSINTPLYDKALTRLGVKPRPVPPVYEPNLVADAILYAASHPVRELVVGGAGKSLALLQRVSPKSADAALTKIAFEGQRTDIPKSDQAPNNLFNHLDGYDTNRGPYSREAKSRSMYTWLRTHPVAQMGLAAALVAAAGLSSWAVLGSQRSRIGRTPLKGMRRYSGRLSNRKPILSRLF